MGFSILHLLVLFILLRSACKLPFFDIGPKNKGFVGWPFYIGLPFFLPVSKHTFRCNNNALFSNSVSHFLYCKDEDEIVDGGDAFNVYRSSVSFAY